MTTPKTRHGMQERENDVSEASISDESEQQSHDIRRNHIAIAAYYRAERRNFEGDGEVTDWLEAEREIDGRAQTFGKQGQASRQKEPQDAPATSMDSLAEAGAELIAPTDIKHWADKLDVSAATLRVAIERVGSRAADVKTFLEQHKT